MTKAQEKAAEKAEAVKRLRRFCRPGTTVYGVIRSVSRSGMSRTIDFYTLHRGELQYLSGWMATVLGWGRDRSGALKVSGCGMDMVFHAVNSLSYAIHPAEECKPREQSEKDRDGYTAGGVARGKSVALRTLRPGYTLRSERL